MWSYINKLETVVIHLSFITLFTLKRKSRIKFFTSVLQILALERRHLVAQFCYLLKIHTGDNSTTNWQEIELVSYVTCLSSIFSCFILTTCLIFCFWFWWPRSCAYFWPSCCISAKAAVFSFSREAFSNA